MEYVHGGDIYSEEGLMDFSVNINPFGPGERVIEAVRSAAAEIGAYPDSRCRKLRSALAMELQVPQECLIFGNGAADILFSLVLAKKPKRALVTAPAFAEYEQALRSVGCKIMYHELKEKENFCLTEEILPCLDKSLDMVFLCSPDNPSGAVISKPFLKRILQKCEKENILMVLDECFWEFAFADAGETMQEEALASRSCFLLRAFTKMHAMPGLRLGYGICADEDLLENMQEVRQPWSVSNVAQAAGIAAIGDKERAAETRLYVQEERERIRGILTKLGIHCYPSSANYILMKSEKDLYKFLKKRGYLIRNCNNYRGLGEGYYRIAVRKREDNEKLLAAVTEICKEELADG